MKHSSARTWWKILNLGYVVLLGVCYFFFSMAYQGQQISSLVPFLPPLVLTLLLMVGNDIVTKYVSPEGSWDVGVARLARWWWIIPLIAYVFFMLVSEALSFNGLTF